MEVGRQSQMMQLSASQHDRFTSTRKSTRESAARLICAKRPLITLSPLSDGVYSPYALTSRSKWMAPIPPTNFLPTLTYRIAAGAHVSGPAPPRLE